MNPLRVVPYVGTWIEISMCCEGKLKEIGRSLRGNVDRNNEYHQYENYANVVVPYVGTWIEIFAAARSAAARSSFPTWERG